MDDPQQKKKRPTAPRNEDFIHPVKTNRTGRIIGWVQSLTTASSHPVHSGIERSWVRLLDMLPGVKSFSSQQEAIFYSCDGIIRRYTPDNCVQLNNGSTVYVEVKPAWKLTSENFLSFWRMIEPAFQAKRLRLRLVTDALVQDRVLDANVRRLHRQRSLIPDEGMAFRLLEKIDRDGPTTLEQLSSHFSDRVLARQTVESLILRKRLSINFLTPLDRAPVFIPDSFVDPFQEPQL